MDKSIPFGYWVRRRRKALDLTQQELAAQAGCSLAMVRKVESELRRPSRQLAERFAEFLAIPPEQLPAFLVAARSGMAASDQLRAESSALPETLPGYSSVDSAASARPAEPQPQQLSRIPLLPTPLVGREAELAQLEMLLTASAARLVTLTGTGGTGKTRLALECARRLEPCYPDGVFFVDLAALHNPAYLASAIARALGLKEHGDEPLLALLKRYLRERELLLVLDNFEQILGAALLLSELLSEAPRLQLLVTSRTVLRLRGEREFCVPPLALPASDRPQPAELLLTYGAICLFVERARDLVPDFVCSDATAPTVAEICRRLDGLPLAIELAVPWLRVLTPQVLLERLDGRLDLLSAGPRDLPVRQRTLRAAIGWSYELLAEEERCLLRRLAVFAGGWTLEAAEQICGDVRAVGSVAASLMALQEHNLVWRQERDGAVRFFMLETIREYALERLTESGEEPELRRRHSLVVLSWLERLAPQLAGPRQAAVVGLIERDNDNLRGALNWAQACNEAMLLLRLVRAAWRFWQIHGQLSEGRRWLATALRMNAESDSADVAEVLCGAGWLAWMLGSLDQAAVHFQESLALARRLGDQYAAGRALQGVALLTADVRERATLYQESLTIFRSLGDQEECAWTLLHMGSFILDQGDYLQAAPLLAESAELFERVDNRWASAMARINLGRVAQAQGQPAKARALLDASRRILQELGDTANLTWALACLGKLTLYEGEVQEAAAYYREGLDLCQGIGSKMTFAPFLEGAGFIALWGSRYEQGVLMLGAAARLRESIQVQLAPLDRPFYEQLLDRVGASLPVARYQAVWEEGQRLPLEQASALAREVLHGRDLR